jgi:hypothetical protein
VTDRNFRLLLAIALLGALYLDSQVVLQALIGLLFFEGVTNWRLSLLTTRIRYRGRTLPGRACDLAVRAVGPPLPFEAERAWRLVMGTTLLIACEVFPTALWFFPWFMGFAILGAGVSGVCPLLIGLQWAGFRCTPP